MSAHYIDRPRNSTSNTNVDPPVSNFYDGQEELDYYNDDAEEIQVTQPMARVHVAPAQTRESDYAR